jgi:hypothetical protein
MSYYNRVNLQAWTEKTEWKHGGDTVFYRSGYVSSSLNSLGGYVRTEGFFEVTHILIRDQRYSLPLSFHKWAKKWLKDHPEQYGRIKFKDIETAIEKNTARGIPHCILDAYDEYQES